MPTSAAKREAKMTVLGQQEQDRFSFRVGAHERPNRPKGQFNFSGGVYIVQVLLKSIAGYGERCVNRVDHQCFVF